MTKPTKWHVRPAKTRISLGIHPVWSESLLWAQWVAKDPSYLYADSKDWSDGVDAQADLSLHWAHKPLCWFCHEAAQMLVWWQQFRRQVSYSLRFLPLFCDMVLSFQTDRSKQTLSEGPESDQGLNSYPASIFWMHKCMAKPHYSIFRIIHSSTLLSYKFMMITAHILGVWIFQILMVP